ncbi:hypothetical protein IID22_03300 [Patescibacteria group bacterium]|nr:hypothetical protein [Patescibacteria group bacterium]
MKKSKKILILILAIAAFLRLWRLSEVPVSLYIDEVDVGYQAYSILQTGKDYYGNSWPIHFHSLVEWRTPFYIYAAVPTVSLFGISPLGVRLPAVIFGVLSVIGMYLLVKELCRFAGNKSSVKADKIALVAALVMAVSPWHIQYSRIAFDGPALIPLLVFGLYFFL